MRRLDQLGPDLPAREQEGCAANFGRVLALEIAFHDAPYADVRGARLARVGAGRNPGSPLLLRVSWRTFVAAAGASVPCQRHGSSEAMIRFMALNRRTFLLLASALGTGARGGHGAASRRIAPRWIRSIPTSRCSIP